MTCDVRFRLGVLLCLFVGVLSRETVAAQPAGTSNSSLPPAAAPVTAPPPPPAATATAPPPPAAATVTTTEVVVPAETSPAAPSEVAWDLLHRRYNSWNGPTGGLYLLDGRTGEPGAVRAQLAIDGFAGSSVFLQGDHVTVSNQSLSLSVTATENLEFFATLNNRTANETRPDNRSLDAIGDVSIGAKVGTRLGRVVDVGGDLRGTFMNKVGGGTFDWGATSLWLRSALSIDLQRLERPVPLIARFNVGYMLDNSSVLVRSTENQRYDALNTSAAKGDEVLHLINRFEREAMGVNRLDRFTFGAGVEVPLELAKQFYLHPIAEWQLGLPVNRQDYDCPFVPSDPRAGKKTTSDDSCYERTPSVIPMNLSFAARIVPPVRGLSALIGVDIGLTGTTKFVRELAPNLPWRILFAVSFDYDARPAPPPVVVVQPPVAAVVAPVVPVNARILGVVTTPEGMPVDGALVRFPDRELTTLSTAADGRFVTEPLPPGTVMMEVTHPDYQPGQCSAVVAEGGVAAEARCTITPKPLVGKLQGQLLETTGAPISGARIIISGPTQALELTDDRGNFVADQLVPGQYSVRIEAGGYFIKLMKIDVVAHADTNLNPSLARKPIAPSVTMSGNSLDAPALTFKTDTSTELSAAALESIAEIADEMLARSDLYLRIQGYGTDAVASSRALLIKQRLVDAGVPESHLEAVGGGTRRVKLTFHQ